MNQSVVIIIGAGAAGMAAAITAASLGDSVVLLEAQSRPGRKLLATGNGRCNLMNLGKPVYYGDRAFAEKVLQNCGPQEILRFWDHLGLKVRCEENRVYPCTFQASTVLDVLLASLRKLQAELMINQRVHSIRKEKASFTVVTESGRQFQATRVIVTAGSPAQPKLGGSSDGLSILAGMGHAIESPRPALTPLLTEKKAISGLSGIRAKCEIRMITDGVEVHRERGELLFTEEGISGICVMQCARFIEPGRSTAVLNWVPDLFASRDDILSFLRHQQAEEPEGEPPSLLRGILAPRLAWAVCRQAGLRMRGEQNAALTDPQLLGIAHSLTHYRIAVTGCCGTDRAQVCAGGALCRDFDPSTMESALSPGLFAAGEVLNVDGDCGGYNLMFAWSSGILAGRNGRPMPC